ncbi:MAG: glycosyltransferase [Bacillus sp. (in: Bacteria)]|nr:glycosyltransferase [Bacillus sp. (in: firmicutes)]MCM1426688.1 glycosyltransferase [Eubacterium sp.]
MKVLFITSKIQQTMNAMFELDRMGHTVAYYPEFAEDIDEDEAQEERFSHFLQNNPVDFILAHIYIEAVVRQAGRYGIKVAIYGMDSPMFSTWQTNAFTYDNCYFFYFDKKEYETIKSAGCNNAYYLPLAADIFQAEKLVITEKEIQKFASDISFVGSLYSQNVYDEYIQNFPVDIQDIFTSAIEGSAFIWDGQSRLEAFMSDKVVEAVRTFYPQMRAHMECYDMSEDYYVRQWFLGRKLTNVERTLLLSVLAQQYRLRLYTREKEIVPPEIARFPEVNPDDAYRVFYASKINLNITLRSIESGVPLRVFDIMSVGGFVLSNYQEEAAELFEEDKEIVLFKTPEEMIEKIDYYLKHEKERIRIGYNGYQKVKNCYTYKHQLQKIISVLF